MTFKELNDALIPSAENLCAQLLPGGQRQGREWVAGSIGGEKGKSLKVVLEGAKAGRWKDFSTDEAGDLLALIAACKGTDAKGAADYARSFLHLPAWSPDKQAPPPFNPLTFGFKRKEDTEWKHGTAAWTYKDAAGTPIAWVVRFDRPDGGKDIMPIRVIDGKHRWRGYTADEKRPLYNLDRLHSRPNAPVLVVEGEKTADAASKLFTDYLVVTWMGGTSNVKKTDWTPLLNRTTPIVLWADADAPGRKAMAYLAQLIVGSKRVQTSMLPDAWDLADPIPEDIDIHAMVDRALVTDPEAEAKAKAAAEKEAKEGEERYHLPPGCRLSEVEHHLLRYGVFEFKGQVWTTYDGRGQRGKWATEISNCTINIHRHIKTAEGAIALVTINTLEDPKPKTLDVDFDVFTTSLSFTKWLGQNACQWWGTDSSFTAYKRLLMDRMRKCKLITELGTHPDGFYTFNNAVVATDGTTTTIDAEGCFQHKDQWYYVPSANSIYADDPGEYAMQKLVYLSENQVDFTTWAQQMVRVYKEHAYSAIAFVLMTAHSGWIFKVVRGIPLMFYYGPGGGGKDALIKSCQAVFGHPQPEIFLTGPNSDKGLMKMFAEHTDLLLNQAEYRKGPRIKDVDETLKSMWGRIGYRIAAMRGKKTIMIPINCTAMVSGNDKPTDSALLRRLILEVVEKRNHSNEDVEEYNRLMEMEKAGVSSIFPQFYKHTASFKAEWYEHYFKSSRPIILEAMGSTQVDSSILHNMQLLLGTMRFYHDKQRLVFPYTPDDMVQHMAKAMTVQLEMRSEGSEVSNFWTCFVWAVKRGHLSENKDYRIKGRNILFHWGDVYGAYASAHMSLFGGKGESPGDMRMKLQQHACYVSAPKTARLGPGINTSAIECNMDLSGTALATLLSPATDKLTTEDEEIFGTATADVF